MGKLMRHPPLRRVTEALILSVALACADATAPARTPEVPDKIVVPQLTSSASAARLTPVENNGARRTVVLVGDEYLDVPPEYLQHSPLIGYTTVDIDGGQGSTMTGHAEMSFYGTAAEQTMTLTSFKGGSQVASKAFVGSTTFLIPMGWSLETDGSLPLPSCGAVATGSTVHSASMVWNTKNLSGDQVTSKATDRYQAECPPVNDTPGTTVTRSDGGHYVDDGYGGQVLVICTTTEYYNGDGVLINTHTECRTEAL